MVTGYCDRRRSVVTKGLARTVQVPRGQHGQRIDDGWFVEDVGERGRVFKMGR